MFLHLLTDYIFTSYIKNQQEAKLSIR